ncbi:outer membrane protein LapE [Acinetobacter colistiniresistens]|uniref:Outer membrane protein LapE n=1 Tax=Acinetobacter colistiniresistens TaxID=280145 RepID=S3TFD4_9GAMM|nr:TolC family protein [Acinetobacter colistiniresistens]EPG39633.1 outer membrane protein LapE [Acinetobacter colistiniresistens]TVT85838.1 RND transporter [Acinetobacter colistiniresistens]
MNLQKDIKVNNGLWIKSIDFKWLLYVATLSVPMTHATPPSEQYHTLKNNLTKLFVPQSSDEFKVAQMQKLSNFSVDSSLGSDLPVVGSGRPQETISTAFWQNQRKILKDAVQVAVQRNPEISQGISALASQNANIDVAKSGYYPQVGGGVSTGDLGKKSTRGQQLLTLSATQMLYDFGKVKSGVDVEKAKVVVGQANVLVKIDDISLDVAQTVINIQRYQKLIQIANQQIAGIRRIQEIANLRANAGISSQADPIQAQSYLQSAQSAMIAQQSLLSQYQQHLYTLLGFDTQSIQWVIPDDFVKQSDLYAAPQFNTIPQMIAAQAGIEVARNQKLQTQVSNYPTLSVKGELSQALYGRNPNNEKEGGFDSAIMFEATSQFYQGGATSSRTRAASFAEEAAKAQVNAVYLKVLDQIRTSREQIENKQRQMQVLAGQQATTIRTRELYQEQYKLGTRTLVDLLNAEQAIHSADSEAETARYDIYSSIAQYIAATGRSRQAYDLNNIKIQGFEVQP